MTATPIDDARRSASKISRSPTSSAASPASVLRGVSFTVAPGEAYGLVGESGCGKSTTAFAAVRYLPRNGAHHVGGRMLVAGDDITGMTTERLAAVPGHRGVDGVPGSRRRR